MSENNIEKLQFSSLNLHEFLLQGVQAVGFESCTPIQAQALPLALAGKDVAGQAQTGTGKTAAFLLALMDRLLRNQPSADRRPNQPRAIVLAPTRELAIQIHKDALALGQFTDLKLGLVYGGVDYEKQRATLRDGVDIIIGTPGRVIDYFKQHVFDLKAIEVVVLDEADRMFDLGFIKDIRYLLRRMPKPETRLNMLFSATLSWRVHELAYEHMNSPTEVEVEADKVTADAVKQVLYHVEENQKIPLLIGLLRKNAPERSIIFVNTKRVAERVTDYLKANGFQAGVLSGDVPQRKRQSLINRFGNGELPLLVATDVAARGLHIPEISHIFNFDLPQNAEDYVHRIGRTARAGATGDAISLGCEQYVFSLMEIEEFLGHKIPVEPVEDELLIKPERPAARPKRPPQHRDSAKRRRHSGGQRSSR